MKNSVYLDYHATTPVDPGVLEKMLPYFNKDFGNAASQHPWGWAATEAVEQSRKKVAYAIKAKPKEVVFTGGATEATNIALFGLFRKYKDQANHIITTNTEHKSVLSVCDALVEEGAELTILEADEFGLVNPEQVEAAIKENTLFVSVIFANNEIGSINPISEIGAVCRRKSVFFHSDAVQAAGKVPVDVKALNIDLMSLTAHKFYGPKGTGALFINSQKPKVDLKPFLVGGGHENGRRSGTLNVAGIVGLAEALEMVNSEMTENVKKLSIKRDRLLEMVKEASDKFGVKFRINGPDKLRKLPNNLSLSFEAIDAARMHTGMRMVAFSTGSACSTAKAAPSHVLKAIGLSDELARNTVRLSVGKYTSEEDFVNFKLHFERALEMARPGNEAGLNL